MTDVLEGYTWPVNALGEIILTEGEGSRTVAGQLPANLIPVEQAGGVRVRLPDFLQPGTALSSTYYKLINSVEDFPTAVGDVITLEDNYTYVITTTVDLQGKRLVAGQNTTILGGSSENCRLKSTGLTDPLITSGYSLPMRFLTIEAEHAIALDATGNGVQALDWMGVNFTDCAVIGTVKNYNNFVMTDSAFLNSGGITFDGTINTVAFNTCLFDCNAGNTAIVVPATATIGRRVRVVYSSFIVLSGETGLDISSSATVPVEGFILAACNFAGGGTYLGDLEHSSEKSLFTNCRGIVNTGSIGQYRLNDNVTATTISLQNTFYKVAGATVAGEFVEKFTISADNRATYSGALTGFFKVTAVATATSGNNQLLRFRVAKNGVTHADSESKVTTSGSGRSENVKFQDILSLVTGDYIEIFVANGTAANNVTVSDMNVIIERLN